MLIEVHMLKNYPPVNLNRDDSGAPKSCFFGGVQRGRISSQCLKRSWRKSDIFRDIDSFGVRTRKLPKLVADKLLEMGVDISTVDEARKMLAKIGKSNTEDETKEEKNTKSKKDSSDLESDNDGKTKQIAFYTNDEIAAFQNGNYPYQYPNVNWVDETFRKSGATNKISLEMSGGGERFRYFTPSQAGTQTSSSLAVKSAEVSRDIYKPIPQRLKADLNKTTASLPKRSLVVRHGVAIDQHHLKHAYLNRNSVCFFNRIMLVLLIIAL